MNDLDEPFESGPFCPHWSHPADCDERCERCSHTCSVHGGGACTTDGCDCEAFVDEDEGT